MKKTVFEDGSWIEEMEDGSVAIHDDGCAGTVACLQETSGKISYHEAPPAPRAGRTGKGIDWLEWAGRGGPESETREVRARSAFGVQA